MAEVAERVNGVGARWWTVVPGVGAVKAERVAEWLRRHQGSTGLVIGGHVAVPRSQLQAAQLAKVVGRTTGVVPFEKFLVPA